MFSVEKAICPSVSTESLMPTDREREIFKDRKNERTHKEEEREKREEEEEENIRARRSDASTA